MIILWDIIFVYGGELEWTNNYIVTLVGEGKDRLIVFFKRMRSPGQFFNKYIIQSDSPSKFICIISLLIMNLFKLKILIS